MAPTAARPLALTAVLLAAASCLFVPPPAGARPLGNGPLDYPPVQCPGGGFGPHLFLPVPGDPTAYVECLGGLPQGGVNYCPSGMVFNAAASACAPRGANVAQPTIAVDGISQQGDALAVKLTYSGINLAKISVDLVDPTSSFTSARGQTDYAGIGPGNAQLSIPLTADGKPHDVTLFARPQFGPPWLLTPGQQVQVTASMFYNDTSGGLGELTQAAQAVQTFSAPGPSPVGAGTWSGSWSAGGQSVPATLTLDSLDPFTGTMDVDGMCTAKWTQSQRNSDNSLLVDAHVISGFTNCADNQWNVTIDQNRITGSDAAHPDSSFSILRD